MLTSQRSQVSRAVFARASKVGETITAHECRHTCASWLDAAGVRPVIVSQLMRHAAPARQPGAAQITQERYTHALPGELEQARMLFDAWLVEPSKASKLASKSPSRLPRR